MCKDPYLLSDAMPDISTYQLHVFSFFVVCSEHWVAVPHPRGVLPGLEECPLQPTKFWPCKFSECLSPPSPPQGPNCSVFWIVFKWFCFGFWTFRGRLTAPQSFTTHHLPLLPPGRQKLSLQWVSLRVRERAQCVTGYWSFFPKAPHWSLPPLLFLHSR